ncbi:MAG: hypothetical protein H7Z13_19750 [Ferruginibacter sp.]|nr:hypothetical protein [Ferruginibacter sp.]
MRKIFFPCVLLALVIFTGSSCKKEKGTSTPPSAPPIQFELLKEINIPNLPSPYYRFEYNAAGKPNFTSFASGLFMYDIIYSGSSISEMKNMTMVNKDRLQYSYDNTGRVNAIRYADSTGTVYKKICFTYNEQKLIKIERERKSGADFITEKTMTFLYHTDGNLSELSDHRHQINGQVGYTSVDRFEQYDNKINVDGFTLIHNEFFEHLVLLPGVQLQKNNPGKLARTGNGFNYKIDYTYTYNDKNLPLTKKGEAIITTGPGAGSGFQTNAAFSYY